MAKAKALTKADNITDIARAGKNLDDALDALKAADDAVDAARKAAKAAEGTAEAVAMAKALERAEEAAKAAADAADAAKKAKKLAKAAEGAADAAEAAGDVADAADAASDVADAAKKSKLAKARDSVVDVSKKVKKQLQEVLDFCDDNTKTCMVMAGGATYAGLWWEGKTRTDRKRRLCIGTCMPVTADDYEKKEYKNVGRDDIKFKTVNDVVDVYPDATKDTLGDYPVCVRGNKKQTLQTCANLCTSKCDKKHPKYHLLGPAVDVAEQGIKEGTGIAVDAIKDISKRTGVDEFVDGFKDNLKWILLGLGIIGAIILISMFAPRSSPY